MSNPRLREGGKLSCTVYTGEDMDEMESKAESNMNNLVLDMKRTRMQLQPRSASKRKWRRSQLPEYLCPT
uniref:Uncharacterized protein n=1 Tax=Nymphaea colorata TaxID=210225 RepID=A0A5K0YYB1_9MAGN